MRRDPIPMGQPRVPHLGAHEVVFRDRGRQVGITEQAQIALGAQHPEADRIPLAPVAPVAEAAHAQAVRRVFMGGGEVLDDAGGRIAAAIVHDQDLEILPAPREVVERLSESDRQALLFVVGGYNDGDGHWVYYGGSPRPMSSDATTADTDSVLVARLDARRFPPDGHTERHFLMALNSRTALLALAENDSVKDLLVRNGMSKGFVRRFVAGETLPEAIATARALQTKHIRVALDLLGENVATEAEAEDAARAYIATLDAIAEGDLADSYISIKLTALGLDLGDETAATHLRQILEAAQAHGEAFVRVDMEGSAYTQRTLDIVRAAHQDFANVGIVLQSYLHRTDDDLQQLIADGIQVRLVKGAYAEPASVAYPDKSEVDAAYCRQMRELLLHGYRPAIASQDEAIIHEAKRFVRELQRSTLWNALPIAHWTTP